MTGTLTLGARILANMEDAQRHPIKAARKKAAEAGSEKEFAVAELLFERFKEHVTSAVDAGGRPKPMTLTGAEMSALHTYNWQSNALGPSKSHFAFPLWQELANWGDSEGIVITWRFGHDGGGVESWWDLCVNVAAKGFLKTSTVK